MRKITQTIVGTTPPLDKNVVWLDSTDSTAPVEKVFINGQWTPMGVDTDDYYTKDDVDRELAKKLNVIKNPVQGNLIAMNSQGQATNSGKKTTDFIANPKVTGQYADVLTLNSNKEPVWTPLTPGGDTIDTEMIDGSEHAVQNGVIKKYVDDNCARKDGYYSTLTAGAAENLVGQTVDKDAYLIRPTATSDDATNEVANGVASVLGMEGNSCVWNQLVQNGDFSNGTTGWMNLRAASISVVDGVFTVTKNGIGTGAVASTTAPLTSQISHKFYISALAKTNTDGVNAYIGFISPEGPLSGNTSISTNSLSYIRLSGIVQPVSTTNLFSLRSGVNASALGCSASFKDVICIDLTLLGIDNFTTVAEVEAWLAQHVGTKPYYAYNAGTILSAQTLGIKTCGQNLLNPTTKQAKLIPYEWEDNSNVYTIKNVPSANDLQITYTPDATGVAVTIDTTESIPDSIDVSDYGGSGILYISSATADTYVCMKWDGQKDDDVVPYEDHTYDFDVRNVYGKVSGAGEYVQCYPNGMRSAGSVHDSLTVSEAVVKVREVDLGTITGFVYDSRFGGFILSKVNIGQKKTIGSSAQLICTKYSRKNWAAMTNSSLQDVICIGDTNQAEGGIIFKDPNITSTDIVSGKIAKLNGVILNYELATPITYTDLIYRDGGIDRPLADVLMNIEVNNWSMEEQLMTPYDANGNPTSIPATISTIYGMDAVEQIDTLNKTCYFAKDVKDNLQALLTCINTNCSETLGGTFSIGDPTQKDSKVFTFTFAPNVEPTNEGE